MDARGRDNRLWNLRELMTQIKPEDLTDAELVAAIAILRLAEARLPSNRPVTTCRFSDEQQRDLCNPPDLSDTDGMLQP